MILAFFAGDPSNCDDHGIPQPPFGRTSAVAGCNQGCSFHGIERKDPMDEQHKRIAKEAMESAATGSRDFGQIVGMLMQAGFDGYMVDFRTSTQAFYLPDGESMVAAIHATSIPVSETFDAGKVREAIREAQTKAVGYTYKGFCEKVVRAGCAGYLVSITGKRVLYFGRDGGTHTEYFPGTSPDAHP